MCSSDLRSGFSTPRGYCWSLFGAPWPLDAEPRPLIVACFSPLENIAIHTLSFFFSVCVFVPCGALAGFLNQVNAQAVSVDQALQAYRAKQRIGWKYSPCFRTIV